MIRKLLLSMSLLMAAQVSYASNHLEHRKYTLPECGAAIGATALVLGAVVGALLEPQAPLQGLMNGFMYVAIPVVGAGLGGAATVYATNSQEALNAGGDGAVLISIYGSVAGALLAGKIAEYYGLIK